MAKVVVTGIKNAIKALEREKRDMQNKALNGMIEAAIIVRRDMEKTAPLTPIDLGNLRASFFITTVRGHKTTGSGFRNNRSEKRSKKNLIDNAAKVAQDTERAKAHAFRRVKAARNLTLIMGYGANYALWVHEMIQKNPWSRKLSGPKWFEKSLKRNKAEMMRAIGRNATITTKKRFGQTSMFAARTETEDIQSFWTSKDEAL